jgi:uncharacterized paraquat-inducible protein A
MLPSAAIMQGQEPGAIRSDLYHGLFRWQANRDGHPRVLRHSLSPATIPCPTTGRLLRVATLDADAAAICPSCATEGHGGFVSFEGDLRMAYACPQCLQLVWVAGV